jgi:hypothetical protein
LEACKVGGYLGNVQLPPRALKSCGPNAARMTAHRDETASLRPAAVLPLLLFDFRYLALLA